MKKKGKCIFNRKGLKHSKVCVCYYCLREYKSSDFKSNKEELSCPYCKWNTVLPMNDIDEIDVYWIAKLSDVVRG